jgi:hypothetical protein
MAPPAGAAFRPSRVIMRVARLQERNGDASADCTFDRGSWAFYDGPDRTAIQYRRGTRSTGELDGAKEGGGVRMFGRRE